VKERQEKRLYGLILIIVVAVALVNAFEIYMLYITMERVRSLEISVQQETGGTAMVGLPPFVNRDFDVVVTPPIVIVPENGGSVDVLVELKATDLSTSQTLVFETHASISGYTTSFNSTSVTLNPGASMGLQLRVTLPSRVHKGIYPMSIIAKGQNTQGGGWLVIYVGTPQIGPPP
jgi:hypothetical protein